MERNEGFRVLEVLEEEEKEEERDVSAKGRAEAAMAVVLVATDLRKAIYS